ncbi:MAG: hypothetical protein KKF68_02140 [Nanoarchaeota archaeon]|nr:hypothetical protein [Nanoarchaeota archaeon]
MTDENYTFSAEKIAKRLGDFAEQVRSGVARFDILKRGLRGPGNCLVLETDGDRGSEGYFYNRIYPQLVFFVNELKKRGIKLGYLEKDV